MKTTVALSIAGMSRHQLYYKPKSTGIRGRPPSQITYKLVGQEVEEIPNHTVVKTMKVIQENLYLRCGAIRMTYQLALKGFIINKKKTARLMRKHQLSLPRRVKPKKQYAQFRVIRPTCPLSMIQMDIKHFWIIRDRRSAFVLTILDTFTKETLDYHVGFSITSTEVKMMWDRVIENHFEPEGIAASKMIVEIRNDGGPQFSSMMIQNYFQDNGINQVFTHPYTPQENGHIESFHSIMSHSLESEYFELKDLEKELKRFYKIYNTYRAHGSNKGLPPLMFRKAYDAGLVEVNIKEKRKVSIKFRRPLYEIPGILSRSEHLANTKGLSQLKIEKGGVKTNPTLSEIAPVYPSPSLTSCTTKKITKKTRNSNQLTLSDN